MGCSQIKSYKVTKHKYSENNPLNKMKSKQKMKKIKQKYEKWSY